MQPQEILKHGHGMCSMGECMPGLLAGLGTVQAERSRFLCSNLGWFSKGIGGLPVILTPGRQA